MRMMILPTMKGAASQNNRSDDESSFFYTEPLLGEGATITTINNWRPRNCTQNDFNRRKVQHHGGEMVLKR